MCLTQFSAPLGYFDRILYVFCCPKCSQKSGQAVVEVLRCQSFNPSYVEVEQPVVQASKPLFAETDDWGDDDDAIPAKAPTAAASKAPTEPPASKPKPVLPNPVSLLQPAQRAAPAPQCPCFLLELYQEEYQPEENSVPGKGVSAEEELLSIEQKFPGAVDLSNPEEDDDSEVEDDFKVYQKRMEAAPSQVLRWCPGGAPLWASGSRPGPVPNCPRCSKPRRFEFQLTSQMIYFLTKDIKGLKEEDNFLQFSTIAVFTCSGDCYPAEDDPRGAYCHEFAFVQIEEAPPPPARGGNASAEASDDDD
jgi:hypothetical protein